VYDIGTQAPHDVWLDIPHQLFARQLSQPALRVIRMTGFALTEGIDG